MAGFTLDLAKSVELLQALKFSRVRLPQGLDAATNFVEKLHASSDHSVSLSAVVAPFGAGACQDRRGAARPALEYST